MSKINILKELIERLESDKKKIDRALQHLAANGSNSDDEELFECCPESSETLMFKVWGLRHALICYEEKKITFDEIDVKAITGLDSIVEALEILGVSTSDEVSFEWLQGSCNELIDDFQKYLTSLQELLMIKFNYTKYTVEQILQANGAQADLSVDPEFNSIFGRN